MHDTTVVINGAGCGSRLKMNMPKSLVAINGRTILDWQLTEMCRSVSRVRMVVGYMGDQVAQLARRLRPSIEILVNDRWRETKTAASLSLGMAGVQGRCVSLDGDLLVHPADFQNLLSLQQDAIGVCDANSSHPVFAIVDQSGDCTAMSYDRVTPFEWTGLVNFSPDTVTPSTGNVFEMIEVLLPAPVVNVRCCEVDTPADFIRANQIWPRYCSPQAPRNQENHRAA
jgi:choline kinase